MKYSRILSGVHIGEHDFDAKHLIEETRRRCVELGLNYVTLRISMGERGLRPIEREGDEQALYEWVQYCADQRIYFTFLYSLDDVYGDVKSYFTREMVDRIKSIAGEYFLGDTVAEMAEFYTCKTEGYRETEGFQKEGDKDGPPKDLTDIRDARKHYIDYLQRMLEADRKVGIETVGSVQPTGFTKYDVQAGIQIPLLETMCGNPEFLMAGVRGSAKAYGLSEWGTYFAIEWYAGQHHEDMLKRKRMLNAYKYAYLAGSSIYCIESGDECIESYGVKYDYDSILCREYRDNLKAFGEIVKVFPRPAGGPKVKVAFVYGNLDGYYGMYKGSTLWGQIHNPDFGMKDAEAGWRLPVDLELPFKWYEQANTGETDYSTHFPYGLYDVIPAEVGSEVFAGYEYLIFVGWNSMTEEIYQNLADYVKQGGRLIMTAAHLNTNTTRNGAYLPAYGGEIGELFGCTLGEIFTSHNGSEFAFSALDEAVLYPGPRDFRVNPVDPNYNHGYARYVQAKLTDGVMAAQLNDDFACRNTGKASIVEHQYGKGYTYLFTTIEYPGCHAVYHMYRRFVKIHLNALNAKCDVRISGSDEVRYAVYEGNTVFLLNTSLTNKAVADFITNGKETTYLLQPGEMKMLSY